jgi:hypothetical protein
VDGPGQNQISYDHVESHTFDEVNGILAAFRFTDLVSLGFEEQGQIPAR